MEKRIDWRSKLVTYYIKCSSHKKWDCSQVECVKEACIKIEEICVKDANS